MENALLNVDRRDRYISMIQFRNRIVYSYNDIDLKVLYHNIQEELADIRELYRAFVLIIEEHQE